MGRTASAWSPPEQTANWPNPKWFDLFRVAVIVGGRRVNGSHQHEQEDHQRPAPVSPDDNRDHGRHKQRLGHSMGPPSQQCIEDVPAIQLPDGDEVQRRNEDSDPTGERNGVQGDVLSFGNGPKVR